MNIVPSTDAGHSATLLTAYCSWNNEIRTAVHTVVKCPHRLYLNFKHALDLIYGNAQLSFRGAFDKIHIAQAQASHEAAHDSFNRRARQVYERLGTAVAQSSSSQSRYACAFFSHDNRLSLSFAWKVKLVRNVVHILITKHFSFSDLWRQVLSLSINRGKKFVDCANPAK